ncbi:MAG: nuclear transport factor 2 family protein [Mycolicibacterium sp.]|nr:nuclear transport factor 2 family protein [Mycolicibacterium sp.]
MENGRVDDTLEIERLLSSYAYAVDTRNWELYRSLFTEKARLDYTSAPFGIAGSLDEIVEWLRESLSVMPMTMHYVTNVYTEITGDTAYARAQFYNPMQFPGVPDLSYCGGYYHHTLIRTQIGWRSSDLREENLWFVNSPFASSGSTD